MFDLLFPLFYPAPAKMNEKPRDIKGFGKPGALRKEAGTVAKSIIINWWNFILLDDMYSLIVTEGR